MSAERTFDQDFLRLTLPTPVEVSARELVRANESRITLTSALTRHDSLGQLRRDEQRLAAANAAVEVPVRAIRHELGLPPPHTS